jgi:hypothetical protein
VIGGLTETLFIHSAVITWYTVLVAVLSGQAFLNAASEPHDG